MHERLRGFTGAIIEGQNGKATQPAALPTGKESRRPTRGPILLGQEAGPPCGGRDVNTTQRPWSRGPGSGQSSHHRAKAADRPRLRAALQVHPLCARAAVTGRDFKMEPATLFDMVGKTEIVKPTLEVVYDEV